MRENIEEFEVPASFGEAFDGGYLGSPDVVNHLVAEFSTDYVTLKDKLGSKDLTPAEFLEQGQALVKRFGDIFSGRCHRPP